MADFEGSHDGISAVLKLGVVLSETPRYLLPDLRRQGALLEQWRSYPCHEFQEGNSLGVGFW